VEIEELKDTTRTQKRFGAYETHILSYYIAPDKAGAWTDSIEMKVEPEEQYSNIEVFLSLDANFKVIDEKRAQHILRNGLAIKFGKNDLDWCSKCYVYLIVNV